MNDTMYERALLLVYTNKVVSVHSDYERPDKFSAGFIVGVNEENMVIRHVSPEGYYDGYILLRTKDIFQLSYDGLYENKIEKLYKMRAQNHKDMYLSTNYMSALLTFSQLERYIISIKVDDTPTKSIYGIASDFNDKNLIIELVSEFGIKSGISYIDTDLIMRIDCDTDCEQVIKLLYNNTYGGGCPLGG